MMHPDQNKLSATVDLEMIPTEETDQVVKRGGNTKCKSIVMIHVEGHHLKSLKNLSIVYN